MRVLVTGGAGFIGSTLVDRLLAEGCDVDAIDDLSTGALVNLAEARAQRNRRFSFHRIDVRSPQLADLVVHRRPEVIFHLAAQARRPAVGAAPAARRRGERARLAQRVRGRGRRRHPQGGVRGLGRHALRRARHACRRARAIPSARSRPYGVSKKAAGDYLHVYREVHGLEYTDLALANVYGPAPGPGRWLVGVVAIFAGRCSPRGDRPTIYGDGAQTRDFLFVDDAVDAFVRAAERGGGLLVNVGTGVETSDPRALRADRAARRRARRPRGRGRPCRRARSERARPRSGRDPARLEALDVARRRPRPSPSTGTAPAR